MGGEVGTTTVTVAGAGSQIVDFTWNTPNIADYASFGADAGHFCLLARIETAGSPDFGLAFPNGTGDLWDYVKSNNNIVWKNVEVVASSGHRQSALIVGNMSKDVMKEVRFVFNSLSDSQHIAFPDVGKIKVNLGKKLYLLWQNGGKKGEGITEFKEQFTIEVEKNNAYIGGFTFMASEIMSFKLDFEFTKHTPWAVHKIFHVTVDQYASDKNGTERRVGGQDFSIRNPKTSDDTLQGGVNTGPKQGIAWWWIIIILVAIVIAFWLYKRKNS